jgi:hypothetical protein
MCLVFQLPPREPAVERLTDEELRRCFTLAHRPLRDESSAAPEKTLRLSLRSSAICLSRCGYKT